jgi:hypothetical protein
MEDNNVELLKSVPKMYYSIVITCNCIVINGKTAVAITRL